VDERYLSQLEQSTTSAKPLPLEVIENVQEAIWAAVPGSVRAVLHRLVDLALQDEATERVGAGRYERSAGRRAHRNGTYTKDLQTSIGPIEDLQVPRVRRPDGSSQGGWQTFDRSERRTYELDRLIGQLFLLGVSGRNLERVSAELWGKKVSRSTVSRATEAFEDEQRAINEAPLPSEVRYLFLDGQNHKVRTEFGVTDRQIPAAFAITPDGTERLLAYRLGSSESEAEWALVLEELQALGLRQAELIVTDGAGGLEKALEGRFADVPVHAASCTPHET
jgi:putative transposase